MPLICTFYQRLYKGETRVLRLAVFSGRYRVCMKALQHPFHHSNAMDHHLAAAKARYAWHARKRLAAGCGGAKNKARFRGRCHDCGNLMDQAKFFATKSQLTTFQNASTNFGRALR